MTNNVLELLSEEEFNNFLTDAMEQRKMPIEDLLQMDAAAAVNAGISWCMAPASRRWVDVYQRLSEGSYYYEL